ncbi:Hypothetical predicted protein [Mytilus galloprovincialis]|uniref:Uncharacterized protein n=2 Tax=Mytilus galloprovincialis TaxID=29158 RepID=A0A8B6HAA4_MYTGA|nr:Hypothetical predicted protein [Mytilus galloprovincialis]
MPTKCLRLNMVRYRMAEGGPPLNSLPDTSPKERDFFGAEIWESLRSKNTMLSYWRRGLTEVLKDHEFDEAEGKKVINFLLSIFRFAILAAKEQGPGATVKILYNLVPNHLNLVSWRRILVGMNLVLEEPDTNNDIRLIGVTLSKKHKREIILQTLDEFSRLLVLLKVVIHPTPHMPAVRNSTLGRVEGRFDTRANLVTGSVLPDAGSGAVSG